MSFSSEVKAELNELNNLKDKESVKYELLGYLITSNVLRENHKIKYYTENEYNINRFAKLLKNMNINNYKINLQGKVYSITFNEKILQKIIIEKKDIETCLNNENILIEVIEKTDKENLQKAIVRGIFLGAGSINNPQKSYHLEIKINNKNYIDAINKLIASNNIKLKNINTNIYIKDGEEISKFLAFIGASKSVIKFEEVRVQRYMNNKINRLVNCKSANLNKILNASVEHIEAIKKLKISGKFNILDDSLKEIAEARLAFPDMTLEELGKTLKKPLGKSGVNYRLKKILEMTREIE